ncbi:MAG TPA: DUF465 domain-containing protein [Rhizobiales bacterium]|nr:DUF465 domain-containing protein [Hyphomicrobiales bacterium]
MEISEEREIREKLAIMTQEHRDMDEAINALDGQVHPDNLQLQRLKKQKLHLKDLILQLEGKLTPDIIA